MAAEIDALRAIADQIIRSNPLDPATWDVDFSPCLPIAKAHLHTWSVDSQNRADRRSRGKHGIKVWSSNNHKNGAPVFIMDSKLETMAIRKMRIETHTLNKSNNALANTWSDVFLSRTSAPYYHGESNAYPFVSENDQQISSSVKDIWVYLRESSGTLNRSISDDWSAFKHYYSIPVRIELFAKSSLVNHTQAESVIKNVYPHRVLVPVFQRGNPSTLTGLGSLLHEMKPPEDKLHVAAMACRGTFQGLLTWYRFNTMLIQGGWPWLRQYSRAYARVVYTAMALIFAAIESYTVGDMAAMRTRLLALAGKLVGGIDGGPSGWKVRKSPYLKGSKLTIPLRVEGPASGPQVQIAGGVVATNKGTKNMARAVLWADRHEPLIPVTQHLPTHIVTGVGCTHSKEEPFNGRVKEAHSLADLERKTADGDSLTLAMTWGFESSIREVHVWLAEKSMMAVQQAEGQCLACAVKFGHCIAALVVIC